MTKFNFDDMANGYKEMAEINLMISRACFASENEAMHRGDVFIGELDRKKAEGET